MDLSGARRQLQQKREYEAELREGIALLESRLAAIHAAALEMELAPDDQKASDVLRRFIIDQSSPEPKLPIDELSEDGHPGTPEDRYEIY